MAIVELIGGPHDGMRLDVALTPHVVYIGLIEDPGYGLIWVTYIAKPSVDETKVRLYYRLHAKSLCFLSSSVNRERFLLT